MIPTRYQSWEIIHVSKMMLDVAGKQSKNVSAIGLAARHTHENPSTICCIAGELYLRIRAHTIYVVDHLHIFGLQV